MLKKFILITSFLTPVVSFADELYYQPHLDMRFKPGNDRTIYSPEIFLPLQQGPNELLFMDLRAMFDRDGAKEGNIGIGYRKLDNAAGKIYGGYAFFDRRESANDAFHSQLTLGGELLSETWDARANVYIPLTKDQKLDDVEVASSIAGNNIFVTGGNFREESLYGFDAEAGYQFAPGLQAFAGGFMFDSGHSETLVGSRLRAQYDINDYLRIGAEWQADNVRGDQKFAELRLRVPLGPKPDRPLTGLQKRMTESAVRDIDIVTQRRAPTDAQKTTAALVNNTTSQPQNIIFVDNNAANGTGTSEAPFNNIGDAMSAASANDIVYIRLGDGTTTNLTDAVNINLDGMQLLGSGVPITFRADLFSVPGFNLPQGISLVPASLTPNIASLINVTGDNTTIAGLDINNQINVSHLASNTLLSDLRVTNNNTVNGINIGTSGQLTEGITLREILIEHVGSRGILAYNVNNFVAVDLVLNDANATGLDIRFDRPGVYEGLRIDGVSGVNNPSDGIAIRGLNAGAEINGGIVRNVTSVGNGTAVWVTALNSSKFNDLLIENINVVDNNYWGVGLMALGPTAYMDATLNNLTLSSIEPNSVQYPGTGLVLLNVHQATVQNSTFANNTNNAVVVSNDDALNTTGGSNITFTNNRIIGHPVGILSDYSAGWEPTVTVNPNNIFIGNGVNQQSTIIP